MTTETATAAAAGQTTTTPAAAAPAADAPPATLLTDASQDATAATQDSPGEGTGEGQGDKPASDGGEKPGDKPASDGGEKPGDKPAGAPEKYELALPEGMTLDEATFAAAEPVLRELGLNNEQATKLASVIAEVRASEAEAFVQQVQEWGKTTQADPEIGGKALEATLTEGRKALAKHGTPELRALLDNTGLGNHPEVVRFFARVGKTILTEDSVVTGERSGGTKSMAERLYGNK
jgi:hypothetical protein